MSLCVITGGSGAGKSTYVYNKILEESKKNPRQNYFILVPDQFTMQTQMDLVKASDAGGIMNVDVLSFSRLAHRIFEETGGPRKPVLDDTGKSLILRKVAGQVRDKMPVIGGNLGKQGYIHEMKSAISEFMQYGIGSKELEELTEFAKEKGMLHFKLKDLQVVYNAFREYINGHYITTEESMDILAKELYRSELIKDSVVVLDGFTGFTPIQNRVIYAMLQLCKTVYVTVSIDGQEDPNAEDGEQKLFFFGKKTVRSLKQLATEAEVSVDEDIRLGKETPHRFVNNKELAFLERNLFRYPLQEYEEATEGNICLTPYKDMKSEVRGVCRQMQNIIGQTGCTYGDIAVIIGDLTSYSSVVEEEFARYGIPLFMDRTKGILLNPFTEYLKAALDILIHHFNYESVFRYLRSGMVDLTAEETDDLENYVLEMGIQGKRAWSHLFAGKTGSMKQAEDGLEQLEYINALRQRFLKGLEPLLKEEIKGKNIPVETLVRQLYAFCIENRVQEKLAVYAQYFSDTQNLARAKEYEQIYGYIMELLDELMELIGKETMSLEEFKEILTAGFDEIKVGTIPKSMDRVIVGDMERTRLKPIKYLFFMGIHDGAIPKKSGKGGIISDMEREFLKQSNMSLAPSPREQMYIQKYYLYLNMTKPSEALYMSYSCMDMEGNALRPSYLVQVVEKMFPHCLIKEKEEHITEKIGNLHEAKELYCHTLRKYAEGSIEKKDKELLGILSDILGKEAAMEHFIEQALADAFYVAKEPALEQLVARILYGESILGSISRMEKYAACAYSYFLQYGLGLKEREEYGLQDKDMGNIFHGVLELFSNKLQEKNYTWMDFPKEEGQAMVAQALEDFCVSYSDALLFDNAENRYILKRMERILNRAVDTISYQLKKGKFAPAEFEMKFSVLKNLNEFDVSLDKKEKLKLTGKIDRIDTWETEDKVYVKVVDYKSGNRDFNLLSFYYGTQLQLVVYLGAAKKMLEAKYPDKEICEAAMLYYHVADPVVEGEEHITDEAINKKVLESLRTKGIVNADEIVIQALDTSGDKKSDCIPVEKKASGEFKAGSKVYNRGTMQMFSDYADYMLKRIGTEIKKGHIEKSPFESSEESACTYCGFKDVCGFDEKIAGNKKRIPEKLSEEEILGLMQDCVKEAE